MSPTIDQKVVEMRFDNRNFEQNVSQTMSTLDKFKQKLNFTGATKGLENIGTVANKVDMSGLSNGVGALQLKFSALEVMGVTALANLTNSAVNAGKRIASALTIDPIKTGFEEYETQINAVQTILANTQSKGSTIDDVNRALEELNKYADKTIYNFTEMTRNIGTFTAAGVDLNTSVNAIQGIANLAAVSGSTSQQASTAMYQLSQALAAGTVKLMDWNSVVNAGMGGEMFQNALKETSTLLGTGAEAAIKAEGSFRESLKTGWLTSEVLTETLKKFTSSGATARVAEYTGLTNEAVKAALESAEAQYGEAEAIEHASKALAEKSGKSADEIKATLEFAKTAEDAATKVKTFTQLWDVLKESAQSGWAQTWKLIVGDFEEAKGLLTPLADFLTGFINKMSDARNNLLAGALGSPFGDLIKKVTGMTDAVGEAVDTVKDYSEVVDQIINGSWGNGQDRWDKLTEAGYDWAHAQNLVNEKLGSGIRYASEYTEAQKEVGNAHKYTVDELAKMSNAQLENMGYTKEQIDALRELENHAKKAGKSISDFIKGLDEKDGRTLLWESFANVGQSLIKIFTAVGQAWRDVFDPMSALQLYNLIAGMNSFSQSLKMSDETAEQLRRTFAGVFALLDIFLTVIGGPIKWSFDAVVTLLSKFNINILEYTAGIGDAVVRLRDWIDANNIFVRIFEFVAPHLKDAAKAIRDWIKSLRGSKNLGEDIANGLINGIKEIPDILAGLFRAVRAQLSAGLNGVPGDIISGLANGIWAGIKVAGDAILELGRTLITKICDVLGIHSPSTVFFAIGGFIIAGLIGGLLSKNTEAAEAIKNFALGLVDIIKNIDWGSVLVAGFGVGMLIVGKKFADAIESFAKPFEAFGEMFESIGSFFKNFSESLKSYFKAKTLNERAKAIKNFAIAIGILAVSVALLSRVIRDDPWAVTSAIGTIGSLVLMITLLSGAVGKFGPKEAFELGKFSLVLIAMSSSILILALALKSLAYIGGGDLLKATAAVTALGAILAGLMYTTKYYNKKAAKVGSTLLKMAAALVIMALVIKTVGKMDTGDIAKGIITITAFAGIMTGMSVLANLSKKGSAKMGSSLLKMAAAIALMVLIVKMVKGMDPADLVKGGTIIAAFGAVLAGLAFITKVHNKKGDKVGTTLLSISAAIALLLLTSKLIAGMNPTDLAKGIVGIAAFGAVVVALVAATRLASGKDLAKLGSTVLMLSISIGMLAGVSALLGLIKVKNLAKGLIAVGLLTGMMALLVKSTQYATDCKGTMIGIAITIGVIAAAITVLSFIDQSKLASATAAISVAIGAFSLLIYSMKSLTNVSGITGKLLLMTGIIVVLAGVIVAMSMLPHESALQNAIALSVLLTALSGAMFILSKAGPVVSTAIVSAALMGAVILELGLVLAAMSALSVTNSVENAKALSTLLLAMSGALVVLGIVGAMGPAAFIGIGALAVMGLAVGELALILGLMSYFNVQESVENSKALSTLLLAMSGALVVLGVVGLLGPAAFIGIGALAVLITGIGGLIAGIGALVTEFPKLEEFLNRGIPIISQIGNAIGSFFGNIVGGFFSEALTSGLPNIATNLSDFMTKLNPFLEGAKKIDAEAVSGVKALADVLLTMTAVNAIEGLTSWLTGGTTLSDFAEELSGLGSALSTLSEDIGEFSPEKATSIKNAAEALKTMAEAASEVNGQAEWSELIFGDNSIAAFADEITKFVSKISIIPELGEDKVITIKNAAAALKEMAKAANNVNGQADWSAAVFGDNSISKFAVEIQMFVSKIRNIKEVGDDKVTTIKNAAKCIKELSSVANNIDGQADWSKKIFGDNSLTAFAEDLKGFVSVISEIDTVVINNFGKALQDLGETGIKEIVKGFDNAKTDMTVAASDAIDVFINGMKAKDGELKDAGKHLGSKAADGVDGSKSSFKTSGKNMVRGFADGIKLYTYIATAAASKMASEAAKAARTELDEHSPSKVGVEIGSFFGLGFVNGIKDYTAIAYNYSSKMARSAGNGLSDAVSRIRDFIDSDIDTQPTIRPVLDLSSVTTGVNAMNGMLNTNSSIGVLANVNGISTMMNRRIQNGGNHDVVSAIDRLRDDFNNTDRANYTIGSVTYDDGSNIRDLVEAVIRTANIQRRV